jgi:hypothetical protein
VAKRMDPYQRSIGDTPSTAAKFDMLMRLWCGLLTFVFFFFFVLTEMQSET